MSVALLSPLAWLYGAAVARRNARYDRGEAVRRAQLPVVSVGNLTVGGTGKTPLVAWICRALLDAGMRPAVVSRGYGGTAGRGPLVLSRGTGPLVSAATAGDEPVQLARSLPGAVVVVGSDRVAGASAAQAERANVVVLDDGFQHRRLGRDLDIVLLDGAAPFGNGRLLPAGPLREPPASLARADLIVATGVRAGERSTAVEAAAARYTRAVTVLTAGTRSVGFVDLDGRVAAPPPRVAAFCAIARPERFRAALVELGVEVVAFHAFRDHRRFRAPELQRFAELARVRQAVPVTTEKDFARWSDVDMALAPPWLALCVETVVHDADALRTALLRTFGAHA